MVCSFLKIKYKSPLVFYVFLFNFFLRGRPLSLWLLSSGCKLGYFVPWCVLYKEIAFSDISYHHKILMSSFITCREMHVLLGI